MVAVIQARMGSTRLPGKTLLDLAGRPVLEHVVRRVRIAKQVNEIVVATTTRAEDDRIQSFCGRSGVVCYRGSSDDVLSRFAGAVAETNARVVVRITADCPLIDPDIVDRLVEEHMRTKADYTSNGIERSWPRGFDVEVISRPALETANRLASKSYEREHVTPYIYEHPDRFRVHNVTGPPEARAPDLRVCIDTREDFEVVRRVMEGTDDPDSLRALDVVSFLRSHPEVGRFNRDVRQKELGE